MPYIKNRSEFENRVCDLSSYSVGALCKHPGELNYVFTSVVHGYIKQKGLCYAAINDVIGALECAKLELYRQIAAPYEDKKKIENGPINRLDE